MSAVIFMIAKHGINAKRSLQFSHGLSHLITNKRFNIIVNDITRQQNQIRFHCIHMLDKLAQMAITDDCTQMNVRGNGNPKLFPVPRSLGNRNLILADDRCPCQIRA